MNVWKYSSIKVSRIAYTFTVMYDTQETQKLQIRSLRNLHTVKDTIESATFTKKRD